MKTELHTDKVKLRAPEKSDAAKLYYLRTHPIVNKFIERDLPKNLSDVEKFIELRNADPNPFYFIIESLPTNEVAGTICLWNINKEKKYAEVGYELLPEFQGKGIMTSALHEIINVAFTELNIETVEAFTHSENLSSRKLLEKFCFKLMPGKTDPDNSNNIIYCLKKA
ncbi:GNAT family N-acetyltransferase [Lacibacter sp. H407]|uniref:GNAT family N-acetyltransferase n=1 Tax=Lacibacter sp. H407 TaxID=3133423 RepID=UPI0030BF86BF